MEKIEIRYNLNKLPLIFVTFTIGVVTSLFILFNSSKDGYEFLFTQPFLYAILFSLVLHTTLSDFIKRPFFFVFAFIGGLRYVILPLLIVIANNYGGRSSLEPLAENYHLAIVLMNYELLIITLLILFKELSVNSMRNSLNININLDSRHTFYIIFIFFSFLSYLLVPEVRRNINILSPSINNEEVQSTVINILVYCFIISKQLLFIIILKKIYILYISQKNSLYLLFALVATILNIGIYFGTNRSDILITAVASCILLFVLFGKKARNLVILLGFIVLSLLITVTNEREYAPVNDDVNVVYDLADKLQVYSGGVYNVAIALETKEYFPEASHPSVLFFDIFRPMIGVNVLVKDLPFYYSNIYFNERIWMNIDRRSQIIPMIGQGNLHFGYLLAPLF